jgi:ribosomal subunit interface protein
MDGPLEIRFHNLSSSEAVEAAIRERVARLEKFFDRIVSCRVAVEAPHRQHRKGNIFKIFITIGVPGGELEVNREPHKASERYPHTDIYRAIRDAFDAAERQVQAYKQKMRGEIKPHPEMFHGTVRDLDADHGFLVTNTGTSLYFHRNALLDGDFESLRPGDAVHYIETSGDTGPIANKVWPAASHQEV